MKCATLLFLACLLANAGCQGKPQPQQNHASPANQNRASVPAPEPPAQEPTSPQPPQASASSLVDWSKATREELDDLIIYHLVTDKLVAYAVWKEGDNLDSPPRVAAVGLLDRGFVNHTYLQCSDGTEGSVRVLYQGDTVRQYLSGIYPEFHSLPPMDRTKIGVLDQTEARGGDLKPRFNQAQGMAMTSVLLYTDYAKKTLTAIQTGGALMLRATPEMEEILRILVDDLPQASKELGKPPQLPKIAVPKIVMKK